MNEERHITLRDVAAAAKVGLATASRALRDDPSTAAKTREHVKKVAAELGYRPDPGMSRLIERRWRGKSSHMGVNLCYLYDKRSATADALQIDYQRYRDAAGALGYSLIIEDIFEFRTLKSLSNRLYAKGVKGLILPILPDVPFDLTPVLRKHAAVSIGVSAYSPECPIVMHDEFFCVTKAWEILTQKGYRRIGMMLPDYPESPSNNLRLAAALVCQEHTHPDNRVPSLFSGYEDQFDRDQFRKWLDRYKPDVLLANTHVRINDLLECGLRIPEDIPFAASNLWDPDERGKIAGFFRTNLNLFEQGIQLINMMIRSGTVGTARANLVELVKGEWIDGKSLPGK